MSLTLHMGLASPLGSACLDRLSCVALLREFGLCYGTVCALRRAFIDLYTFRKTQSQPVKLKADTNHSNCIQPAPFPQESSPVPPESEQVLGVLWHLRVASVQVEEELDSIGPGHKCERLPLRISR